MTNLNDDIIDNLNFSGDNKSWFDLWHHHIEVHPENETDWTIRIESLHELVRLFKRLKEKLKKYPSDYQLWIEIYDEYVGDDAIYIHSKNPNSDNFPIKASTEFPPKSENPELKKLLLEQGLSIAGQRMMEGNVYFLYDENAGVAL
jgi:hypothetical protein